MQTTQATTVIPPPVAGHYHTTACLHLLPEKLHGSSKHRLPQPRKGINRTCRPTNSPGCPTKLPCQLELCCAAHSQSVSREPCCAAHSQSVSREPCCAAHSHAVSRDYSHTFSFHTMGKRGFHSALNNSMTITPKAHYS